MEYKIISKDGIPITLSHGPYIKYQSLFDAARKMTFTECVKIEFTDLLDTNNALRDIRDIIEIYKQHNIVFNVYKSGFSIYIYGRNNNMYRLEHSGTIYYIAVDNIAYMKITEGEEYSFDDTTNIPAHYLNIYFAGINVDYIYLKYNTIEEAQNIADNIRTFKHSNLIVSGFK